MDGNFERIGGKKERPSLCTEKKQDKMRITFGRGEKTVSREKNLGLKRRQATDAIGSIPRLLRK